MVGEFEQYKRTIQVNSHQYRLYERGSPIGIVYLPQYPQSGVPIFKVNSLSPDFPTIGARRICIWIALELTAFPAFCLPRDKAVTGRQVETVVFPWIWLFLVFFVAFYLARHLREAKLRRYLLDSKPSIATVESDGGGAAVTAISYADIFPDDVRPRFCTLILTLLTDFIMVIRTSLILVYWFAFGSFHCIVKFSRCFRGWRFGVLSQYDQTSHPAFQLHIIMTLPLDELGSVSVVDVPQDEVSLDPNVPIRSPNPLNNTAKLAILVIGPQFCYEIDGQRYEKAELLSEAFRKEQRRNLLYISGKPKSAVLQSTV